MTSSALVLAGDFPSLASLTNCPICLESFDPFARKPKIVSCGHSVCLTCLDRLVNGAGSAKCPLCQQVFDIPTGDVQSISTNFALIKAITEYDRILTDRSVGLAKCSECQIEGDEKSFRLCIECCSKKGDDCHPNMDNFNMGKLEELAVCSGCVLENHNSPGHSPVRFVQYRIRRDVENIASLQEDVSTDIQCLLEEMRKAATLVEQENQLLSEMVKLSANVDSSIVLASLKKSISQNSKELKKAVTLLSREKVMRFNREIEKFTALVRAEKDEFASHCVKPAAVEVKEEPAERVSVVTLVSLMISVIGFLWYLLTSVVSTVKALTK